MYKLVKPDGYDFYSSTINYADNIGKIIRVKDYDSADVGVCGKGLHASRSPNNCFAGAEIPCRAFKVQGIQKIAGDKHKCRYQALKVLEEIEDLNKLFGWNYNEAVNPIHPFDINPPEITTEHIDLIKAWTSVWDSVTYSIEYCIRDSIWDFINFSVQDLGKATFKPSVQAVVWAYIGSLFPNIKTWKYIEHKKGEYPFQPAVDLWKIGLIPSLDGEKWRLHGGKEGKILWEEPEKEG